MVTERHWTEDSAEDFVFFIASDFVDVLEREMKKSEMSKGELARILGVTKGRVSQILHNPGNLTLELVVRCARAVGIKVALLAYDDLDSENVRGPIVPEVFLECWNSCGKPKNMFEVDAQTMATAFQHLGRFHVIGTAFSRWVPDEVPPGSFKIHTVSGTLSTEIESCLNQDNLFSATPS